MSEIQCIDCGSKEILGPDFEGFYDCQDCGAAWLPTQTYNLAWDRGQS